MTFVVPAPAGIVVQVRLRQVQPGDAIAVGLLAQLGDDLGQFAGELLRAGDSVRVAVVDDEVVGAAKAWGSAWHPAWNWAHVAVSPAHRRQGVGSALLKDLQSAGPVKTKVRMESGSAQFVAAAGWQVIQASANYVLAGQPTGAVDAEPCTQPRDCIADAYLTFYRRAHRWDPVGGGITAEDMLAATVEGATCTLLVGEPKHPDAVACMWEEDEAWEFSGGPCRDGAEAAAGLLLAQARAIAGRKPVLVEADSDMAEMLAALHRLGAEPTDVVHIMASTMPPTNGPVEPGSD